MSCSDEQANRMPRIRPATVQIDTVRASYCQDGQRSSNGWAASGRKPMGAPTAFR
nr:hypothetical protein [Streptomyces rhizosphaericus]